MTGARRRSLDENSRLVLLSIGTYLSFLLVVPLGALAWSVIGNFASVVEGLGSPDARYALGLSLAIAVVCIVVNGLVGIGGALVLVRQKFWGRRLLDMFVDIPLALSPVMTGLAFLLVFGRSGLMKPFLDYFDVQFAFAPPGVLIATLFVTLPFTLREVALVMAEVGESEEQAAQTLGASWWQVFWYVTLPKVRGGLTLGTTLTLARALGEFGAVLVVGGAIAGKTQTATTFIHASIDERQEPAANGMALILAAAAIAVLGILQKRKGS